MTEQICIRYPAELANPLAVSQTVLIIDVPTEVSGIQLARDGLLLNKDYTIHKKGSGYNAVWFIPPSQVLWVKRL